MDFAWVIPLAGSIALLWCLPGRAQAARKLHANGHKAEWPNAQQHRLEAKRQKWSFDSTSTKKIEHPMTNTFRLMGRSANPKANQQNANG